MRRVVSDLWLAIGLVAIIAMMIVPVPTALLDVLLVGNVAVAVGMLVAALLVRDVTTLASFPTLLVVATLFRVALAVSTTRLILAYGNAGDVVAGFGASAAAGNVVVGLVVFAVITVVQLLVVAKGAERIAEVAARFALDALPGKQLAIDSELKAGNLDGKAASAKRVAAEQQAQGVGAMDGAMKFVKGDAIAQIVIVVINLIGGLVIATAMRGMSAKTAMATYSVLSIGEGLLAQIPSLLSAVAAGILVARMATASDDGHRTSLAGVVLATPGLLGATAVVVIVLGLLPGMPRLPFIVLGLGLLAGWGLVVLRQRRAPVTLGVVGAQTARLVIEHPAALDGQRLLAEINAHVQATLGVPLPSMMAVVAPAGALVIHGVRSAVPGETSAAFSAAVVLLAPEWFGPDQTSVMVEQLYCEQPVLVKTSIPAKVSLGELTGIVVELLSEGVRLPSLAPVLLALAEPALVGNGGAPSAGPGTLSPAQLAERVRGKLRRQLAAQYAPSGQLEVWTLDGMIEDAIRAAADPKAPTAPLAIEADIANDIITAVRDALVPAAGAASASAVIMTGSDIRRPLRSLLATELPAVTVLAPAELAPGVVVKAAGQIRIGA